MGIMVVVTQVFSPGGQVWPLEQQGAEGWLRAERRQSLGGFHAQVASPMGTLA